MITFFRKIRKQLANENSFINYSKYAIGEILLVVIGILIALSINNWNEQRKQKATLSRIYRIIADDLISDSIEVAGAINFYELRKNIFKEILNDSLTSEAIADNKFIGEILVDIRVFNIEKRGYNLLMNFENVSGKNNDSLTFRIINFYANAIFYGEKIEKMIIDDLVKTNDIWKGKIWYANMTQDKNDDNYMDYMLNDQEFKNLCGFRYNLYYDNYEPIMKHFQKESQQILDAIHKRLTED
jgi:hypothetical protein